MRSLVLASNSPRRAFLLKECGFEFIVQPTHASEDFDDNMIAEEVPAFLASKKAEAAFKSIKPDQLILTADTVVILDSQILNKPDSSKHAIEMLRTLSGKTHKVITAVCLTTPDGFETIEELSWVTFNELKLADIERYVEHFKPLDKAGAYGAQECLPENYNPCSGHERDFLQRINKQDLIAGSKPNYPTEAFVAIQEIAGSYFNVMGLPIAHIYDKIRSAL
jgi:septum formation protein